VCVCVCVCVFGTLGSATMVVLALVAVMVMLGASVKAMMPLRYTLKVWPRDSLSYYILVLVPFVSNSLVLVLIVTGC
jgi:hypothetical protein